MARLTVLIATGVLLATGAAAQVATSSSTTLPSGANAAGIGTSTDATVQGRGAAGTPGTFGANGGAIVQPGSTPATAPPHAGAVTTQPGALAGAPGGTGTTASTTGSGTVVADPASSEPGARGAPSTRIELGGPPSSASPSGARGSVVPGPFEPSLIGGRAACPPDMRKRDGVCIPAPSQ